MSKQHNNLVAKKQISLSSWISGLAGILLLVLSVIPFTSAITWLNRLEADGTFDSLTAGEYQQLMMVLLLVGILCLATAAAYHFWRVKLSSFFLSRGSKSVWQDLKCLFLENLNWRDEKIFLVGLLGVTVLGIIARLFLYQRPVGYDEAYTFIHFASRDLRYIVTDYSGPNNHIFHSILVALVYRLVGTALWALRLPAFVAGVLCIPAGYLAGKKLFHPLAGLIGAAGISLMPVLIDYSNNARGYTLVCLFALLGLWLAADLAKQDRLGVWCLFSVTSILGFYTIPTYLYPFAVINLWLLIAGILERQNRQDKIIFVARCLFWGCLAGCTVLVLYTPVFVFGTGLDSITGNEFVQSLTWHDFRKTLINRMPIVWNGWWFEISGWLMGLSVIGFGLSFPAVFSKESAPKRYPLFQHLLIPAVVAIGLLLFIQRVVPLARVWMFLLTYYLVYAAIGISWLLRILWIKYGSPRFFTWGITGIVLIFTIIGVVVRFQNPKYSQVEPGFDYSAAHYLAENMSKGDRIFVVAPASMRVAYYMHQLGMPLDLLYDRDRPDDVERGYVVVIENSKYGTPEMILEFLHLTDQFASATPELVFKEKRMEIYWVDATP